jgi:hypothetical protein
MVKYFALLAWLVSAAAAQDVPKLSVTPSFATVLLGDSHPFRAVNLDGRPASFVRWDSSSTNAVIYGDGSDIEVDFRQPGDYIINAYSAEGSGSAKIHVLAYRALPYGSTKWRVDSFTGCHTKQLVPAIPAAGSTNDIFMVDECPRGQVIRALTADGLENWRTWTSEKEVDLSHLGNYEPKALLAKSVCDGIKFDMSRDDVIKVAMDAKAQLPDSEKAKDVWIFEEEKGECRVTFHDGKVAKKQKVIAN